MTALRLKVRPSRPAGDAKGFVVRNPAFAQVLGDAPRLERVIATDAHEGPVYDAAEDALYFTTVPRPGLRPGAPRVDIMRLALDGDRFDLEPERLTTVRADANAANGMTAVALGEIRLAGAVNFTFGGPRRDALFITTDDAIWAAVLHTTGS